MLSSIHLVLEVEKERISSGVEGLDKLLGGGYVSGRSILLAGGPGTGKSILTWHFIFQGLENGENAILLSLDQKTEMIIEDMKSFGWDPEPALNENRLIILSGDLRLIPRESGFEYIIAFDHPMLREQPFTVQRLADLVRRKAGENKAKRLIIDGLGPLIELGTNRFEMRQMVYGFLRELSAKDATVLITHELRTMSGTQNDEMPYFICDGVIRLGTLYTAGDYIRTLRVIKLRGANHSMRPVMFKINDSGIIVFPDARLPD
ncbi:MAG: hypothetical protein GF411_03770 [Candidatus Lokiarchaeota archaeon]|nr:hypothetical protein [Candidatus Lokiarchaeota archaeon]